MLKFEAIVKVGDTIKAFDFEPFPGRTEMFVVGKVISVGFGNGAKVFILECTEDSMNPEPEYSRVGHEVWVPMEITFDYDNRITVVE